MPINGFFAPGDEVVNGNANGWADQSGLAYGNGGNSYNFGFVINNYGTWGQLICVDDTQLAAADWAAPTGLNGHMPANPSPDGSNWVQGHLVNGECGGSGAINSNLTPISHNVNMWHRGPESVLQRLVRRGAAAGMGARQFNPNLIANTWLIYRTQALPPPNGGFATVPLGITVSLGVVINNVLQTNAQVTHHFANAVGVNRWFADAYYAGTVAGANLRAGVLALI